MINLRSAVFIAIGLIIALGWAVMPPRSRPQAGAPVPVQQKLQCPPGARLDGKLCVCPAGTVLAGAACVRG